MRTTLLTRQDERCLGILEMIAKVDRRIEDHKKSFYDAKQNTPFFRVADWYFKRWEANVGIKERLVKSYSDSLAKIFKPTINKILQTA